MFPVCVWVWIRTQDSGQTSMGTSLSRASVLIINKTFSDGSIVPHILCGLVLGTGRAGDIRPRARRDRWCSGGGWGLDVSWDMCWEEDLGWWSRLEKGWLGPLMTSVCYQCNQQ